MQYVTVLTLRLMGHLNVFCQISEEVKAKEGVVWEFLESNLARKMCTIDEFFKFYQESKDFLITNGISEGIIRHVWKQYINHLAEVAHNKT